MAFRPPRKLRAAIEAFADKAAISVSEAVRQLIEAGLERKRGQA